MKAHSSPNVKQVWLISFVNYLYCFGISLKRLLTMLDNYSILLNSSMSRDSIQDICVNGIDEPKLEAISMSSFVFYYRMKLEQTGDIFSLVFIEKCFIPFTALDFCNILPIDEKLFKTLGLFNTQTTRGAKNWATGLYTNWYLS